jgi:hypothetical protein
MAQRAACIRRLLRDVPTALSYRYDRARRPARHVASRVDSPISSPVRCGAPRPVWDRRNSAQPGPSRRGAGSIPALLSICQTVDGATVMPRPASSPWIRRYPQDSFSRASCRTIDRTLRCVAGRPELARRDRRACRRRTMSRCQRKIVPGVTISRIAARRPAGSVPASSASNARSGHVNANEREAAPARRQQADGAASRSPRLSTTTPAVTSSAPTPHGTRSGKSASSPQAKDLPISRQAETAGPEPGHTTGSTAICKASARATQVFGTHR